MLWHEAQQTEPIEQLAPAPPGVMVLQLFRALALMNEPAV
jgi:hypothetical protein